MNPYKVLGVDSHATESEVKSAWRSLAKLYHPDNPKTGDAVKFEEAKEAFQMLSGGTYIEEKRGVWIHKSAFTVVIDYDVVR